MKIGNRWLIGTASWAGIFNGKPAIVLSYYGGADIWVFENGWKVEHHENSCSDLKRWMGIPWSKEEEYPEIRKENKMAGCKYKYKHPTKKNVLDEMIEAYRTLDHYLETQEGMGGEAPEIFMQLSRYINELKEELLDTIK